MLFDPLVDMGIQTDLNTREGVEKQIQFDRFHWCMLRNGHLEIWDETTNCLMGRTRAYIPKNVMINSKWFREHMEELEATRKSFDETPH